MAQKFKVSLAIDEILTTKLPLMKQANETKQKTRSDYRLENEFKGMPDCWMKLNEQKGLLKIAWLSSIQLIENAHAMPQLWLLLFSFFKVLGFSSQKATDRQNLQKTF